LAYSGAAAQERVDELLARFDLAAIADAYPTSSRSDSGSVCSSPLPSFMGPIF
jgi:hypothetical protein